MGILERFVRPPGGAQTLSRPWAPLRPIKARRPRRGCGTAARRRARRYVAKRRLPRSIWPILAAFFLVAIVFGRRPEPAHAKLPAHVSRAGTKIRRSPNEGDKDAQALPSETGAALKGEVALQCRPASDFQAKHVAQVLAFLIRNRGKLDTDVVRAKWKRLDDFSIPLAVYLRDIEAGGDWAALEAEIAVSLPPLKPDSSSVRQGKILKLVPEWERRGEELLASLDSEYTAPITASTHLPDDDGTPPRPTRP